MGKLKMSIRQTRREMRKSINSFGIWGHGEDVNVVKGGNQLSV